MKTFLNTIKYDYLQRTRSYAFLITMCLTLGVAYTFVPSPNATYATVRIAEYQGHFNSYWIGYVTAIMTSIFLFFVGFYLVNNSIKKDIDTKVGQIIATTKVTNFTYLLSKVFSNFLVLLSIVFVVFLMSISLFFWYNTGFDFEIIPFIKPYVLITIPAMFLVSVFAVIFEVLLGKYSVLQNVGFFIFYMLLMTSSMAFQENNQIDIIGSRIVTYQMEKEVAKIKNSDKIENLNIGYSFWENTNSKRFVFNGLDFPTSFILSRLLLVLFGFALIGIVSLFFHRFDIKKHVKIIKNKSEILISKTHKEISLINLPIIKESFGIFPFIKTELLLLFRNGKKWLWFVNLVGMLLLVIIPIKFAIQFVLPILWFLQVSRLSNLTTKEVANNVHYFAFASYKPLSRLLFSQLFAGIILMLFLAFPLIVKLVLVGSFTNAISVILGAFFIVLLASALGVLTQSKKLFEVLFFMIAYANINGVPFLDYFGGVSSSSIYNIKLLTFAVILGIISVLVRKMEIEKN